jgi:hypothetical protein
VQTVTGGTLPAGLSATTIYFVISSAANTFQVSLTSAGAAVNITTSSECVWQKTIPQTYSVQGTYTLNSGAFDLNG